MQTLTRRGVGDAAAGLGLHFLHMSEGPFSHDTGQLYTRKVIETKARMIIEFLSIMLRCLKHTSSFDLNIAFV